MPIRSVTFHICARYSRVWLFDLMYLDSGLGRSPYTGVVCTSSGPCHSVIRECVYICMSIFCVCACVRACVRAWVRACVCGVCVTIALALCDFF